MIIPTIKVLSEKKFVGKRLVMTMAENRTFELWKSFMSRRHEIRNKVSSELFSIQVYDHSLDFDDFDQYTLFEKWAAVEVSDMESIPDEMEAFSIEGGLYAVFEYKGNSNDFADTFMYIFKTWLPASGYELDQRAHFEILGEKYRNNDPESEEEVWIPVRMKL